MSEPRDCEFEWTAADIAHYFERSKISGSILFVPKSAYDKLVEALKEAVYQMQNKRWFDAGDPDVEKLRDVLKKHGVEI